MFNGSSVMLKMKDDVSSESVLLVNKLCTRVIDFAKRSTSSDKLNILGNPRGRTIQNIDKVSNYANIPAHLSVSFLSSLDGKLSSFPLSLLFFTLIKKFKQPRPTSFPTLILQFSIQLHYLLLDDFSSYNFLFACLFC